MQSEVKKTVDYTHETVSGILSGIISARQSISPSARHTALSDLQIQ